MPKKRPSKKLDKVMPPYDGPPLQKTIVGSKCIVTMQVSGISRVLAHGSGIGKDSNPMFSGGSTFYKFRSESAAPTVEIKLPYYFAYNTLRRGKRRERKDQISLTNDHGEPLPQIMLLVAIRTAKLMDWVGAISSWKSLRSDLMEGVDNAAAKGLSFMKNDIEILLPAPPEEKNAEPVGVISQWETWSKEWIFDMVKAGYTDYLCAWNESAQRAFERLKIAGADFAFIDGIENSGESEVDEMSRVLRAIKRATLVGGGVPYISRVATILESDGRPKMDSEHLRSLRATLGFSWIPSEPDWKKHWAPFAEKMGWI